MTRLIKRPDRYPGMEKVEHTERDSAFLLATEFGLPEFQDTVPTEPAALSLEPAQPTLIERIFGRKKA